MPTFMEELGESASSALAHPSGEAPRPQGEAPGVCEGCPRVLRGQLPHPGSRDGFADPPGKPGNVSQNRHGLTNIPDTNAIERLNEEVRRRVKTQGALPTDDAAATLLFRPVASGQIKLRKLDGWRRLSAVIRQRLRPAAWSMKRPPRPIRGDVRASARLPHYGAKRDAS